MVESAFPYIRKLLHLYVLILQLEAVVERGFSKMKLMMTDKHTRLEPESLDSLMRISYNSKPQMRKSTLLLMSRRPVEALVSFLKASKFSWASFVKTYQHSYGWNFRQFLFVFIYFIKRFYVVFVRLFFLLIKTKKLCLDNIIQSWNILSNYYSF